MWIFGVPRYFLVDNRDWTPFLFAFQSNDQCEGSLMCGKNNCAWLTEVADVKGRIKIIKKKMFKDNCCTGVCTTDVPCKSGQGHCNVSWLPRLSFKLSCKFTDVIYQRGSIILYVISNISWWFFRKESINTKYRSCSKFIGNWILSDGP